MGALSLVMLHSQAAAESGEILSSKSSGLVQCLAYYLPGLKFFAPAQLYRIPTEPTP